MFFPEKIKSLKPDDRVLEIGPGGTPHPRADIFLERVFHDSKIAEGQRGYAPELKTVKKVIYYEGGKFPFKDKEFDYVICSHVLEHVEDVDFFISEVNRVGKAGYLEYPLIYYDFIYNFPEHITFVKRRGDMIMWMPKEDSSLSWFKPVNIFFYESLKKNYTSFLVDKLKNYFFEGFEWSGQIRSCRTGRIEDLVLEDFSFPDNRNKTDLLKRIRQIGTIFKK